MSRVPHVAREGKKRRVLGEPMIISREEYGEMELDSRLEVIRSLIPLGLIKAYEELFGGVEALVGGRYDRKREEGMGYRHGWNRGTVKLGGQRVAVRVPRVRRGGTEVPLESYARLHRGGEPSERLLRQVLYGISCRNYGLAAESVPGAIGLSSASVSREFIEASAAKLKEFRERDLNSLDTAKRGAYDGRSSFGRSGRKIRSCVRAAGALCESSRSSPMELLSTRYSATSGTSTPTRRLRAIILRPSFAGRLSGEPAAPRTRPQSSTRAARSVPGRGHRP